MISEQEAAALPAQTRGEGGSHGVGNEGKTEVTLPLKKGPWTAEEDEILIDHVRKYGEGRWSAVQKYSGLARCGKSCRLRWANHLRPDLKKGSFTADEERLILELQAKFGNKWARIAAELPGRTDNEIKNFWNSRIKRRLRDTNNQNNQGHQQSFNSSQPTTPTASSSTDFHFQYFPSSPLPPRPTLGSPTSSGLSFTIARSPPLLSTPARFKRHRRLSSTGPEQASLGSTGLTASRSMNSLLLPGSMSPSFSLISSPTSASSSLLSPLASPHSPMVSPLSTPTSPLLSSLSQPASPGPSMSSMPNSPMTPQNPGLLNSPRLTSLTSSNSTMFPSFSTANSMLVSSPGSPFLSSSGCPGSPILSLVGSTSPTLLPSEASTSSLMLNQQHRNGSFLFDAMASDGSAYLQQPELPSSQLSQMNTGITMNRYDHVLLEDPSQSDVILDLKMKAGWTRGLKKKTRPEAAAPGSSKMNTARARCNDELLQDQVTRANNELLQDQVTRANNESLQDQVTRANNELLKEQAKSDVTFDSEQTRAALQDSSGLLEDMLKESRALEGNMTSGTETCLVFSEEKPMLEVQNDCIDFSPLPSSAGDNRNEEQVFEQISSMQDDLSKLLEFDSSSLAVPEFYNDCGQISNEQYSVASDNNIGHEGQQIASGLPLAHTNNDGTIPVSCSLDNLPGMQ